MVLQHSSVSKSLHWHVIVILFNAKVGIFPPSYAVIVPSFISCFHYFYCLEPCQLLTPRGVITIPYLRHDVIINQLDQWRGKVNMFE